ncbi:T9SS type A sorting domain-containing protein [Flammeovirga agarivorans]|uniref:T9SS type A sorting domain-containing protein n=1 Tax=Flammeovirga agarivorans TaxID=2726742 RepID=A0A7X8SK24_9BACT|nr:T9SS type A sorting domain-containing protein [Flammeovirga agarivorans]NLR91568.1 T9SS type A sorting domain-containing protein [Flammeovirga agarivorans]
MRIYSIFFTLLLCLLSSSFTCLGSNKYPRATFGRNTTYNGEDHSTYSIFVPRKAKFVEVSSIGLTTFDTNVGIYDNENTSYYNTIDYNNDAFNTRQSYLKTDIAEYQSQYIYIRWDKAYYDNENYPWELKFYDEDNKLIDEVELPESVIRYGREMELPSKSFWGEELHYELETPTSLILDQENNLLSSNNTEGTYKIRIYTEGSAQYSAYDTLVSIYNRVHASGKPYPALNYSEEEIFTKKDLLNLLNITSNAENPLKLSSNNYNVSIEGNAFRLTRSFKNSDIHIRVEIDESEHFAPLFENLYIPVTMTKYNIYYDDYYAIKAIYDNMNVKNWESNQWFNENKPATSWSSHLSFKEQRLDDYSECLFLYSISLTDDNTEGEIPEEANQLQHLSTLYVRSLANVPNFDNLSQSSLSRIYIEHSGFDHLSLQQEGWKNLKTVTLNYPKRLDASFANWIGKWTSLEKLEILRGTLTEIPDEFYQLTALRELDLNSNPFVDFDEKVSQLTQLRKLEWEYAEGDLPKNFEKIPNLSYLNLSHSLDSLLPLEITQLTSLDTLVLNYCNFDVLPKEFNQLSNLKSLSLSNNYISHVETDLTNLTQVSSLNIDRNKLSLDELDKFRTAAENATYLRYNYQYNERIPITIDSSKISQNKIIIHVQSDKPGRSYQWKYNGYYTIDGATSKSFTVKNFGETKSSVFCEVKDDFWTDITYQSASYFKPQRDIKLIVKNIPENTPEGVKIHAVGNITNNLYYKDTYPLEYNEELDQYEIILNERLGKVTFQFSKGKNDEFVEVNRYGNKFTRTFNPETLTNTEYVISDIVAWNYASPYCLNTINVTAGVHLTPKQGIKKYRFTANQDMTIRISSYKHTFLNTYLEIYDDCNTGGYLLGWSSNHENSLQSQLDYTLFKGQSINIVWEDEMTMAGYDSQFEWELSILNGSKLEQTDLSTSYPNIKSLGNYSLDLKTDNDLPLQAEVISGNAIIEDNILKVIGRGNYQIRFYNEGDKYYSPFETVKSFSLAYIKGHYYDLSKLITTNHVGVYEITEEFSNADEPVQIEFSGDNITYEAPYLTIHKKGQFQAHISTSVLSNYTPLDETIYITVNSDYSETLDNFFEEVTTTGYYDLPSIIRSKGFAIRSLNDHAEIEAFFNVTSIKINELAKIELELSKAATKDRFKTSVSYLYYLEESPNEGKPDTDEGDNDNNGGENSEEDNSGDDDNNEEGNSGDGDSNEEETNPDGGNNGEVTNTIDTSSTQFSIFPNPANHIIYVQNDVINTANCSLFLSDLSGKSMEIDTQIYDQKNVMIDISTLQTGVYILLIVDDQGRLYSQKIIKE